MTSLPALIAVTGAVCGVLTTAVVVIGLFFSARQHERERARDDAARERQRSDDLAKAREEGRREMRPEINLLRSERDDARRERDRCEQEAAAAKARCERLEEELIRRRNGGA